MCVQYMCMCVCVCCVCVCGCACVGVRAWVWVCNCEILLMISSGGTEPGSILLAAENCLGMCLYHYDIAYSNSYHLKKYLEIAQDILDT